MSSVVLQLSCFPVKQLQNSKFTKQQNPKITKLNDFEQTLYSSLYGISPKVSQTVAYRLQTADYGNDVKQASHKLQVIIGNEWTIKKVDNDYAIVRLNSDVVKQLQNNGVKLKNYEFQVKFVREDNKLVGKVVVDNVETKRLLDFNLSALQNVVRKAGVNVKRIDIVVRSEKPEVRIERSGVKSQRSGVRNRPVAQIIDYKPQTTDYNKNVEQTSHKLQVIIGNEWTIKKVDNDYAIVRLNSDAVKQLQNNGVKLKNYEFQVKFVREDNKLVGKVVVDNVETKRLLDFNLSVLQDVVRKAGVNVERIDIVVRSEKPEVRIERSGVKSQRSGVRNRPVAQIIDYKPQTTDYNKNVEQTSHKLQVSNPILHENRANPSYQSSSQKQDLRFVPVGRDKFAQTSPDTEQVGNDKKVTQDTSQRLVVRNQESEVKVQNLMLKVQNSEFRVQSLEFKVQKEEPGGQRSKSKKKKIGVSDQRLRVTSYKPQAISPKLRGTRLVSHGSETSPEFRKVMSEKKPASLVPHRNSANPRFQNVIGETKPASPVLHGNGASRNLKADSKTNLSKMDISCKTKDGIKNEVNSAMSKSFSVANFGSELKMENLPKGISLNNFERLAEQLRLNFKGGRSEAKIELKPDWLGKLSIKLIIEDTKLVGKIVVDTFIARDLLESSLSELKSALKSTGLEVEDFNITLSKDSGHQENSNDRAGTGARYSQKSDLLHSEWNLFFKGINYADEMGRIDYFA